MPHTAKAKIGVAALALSLAFTVVGCAPTATPTSAATSMPTSSPSPTPAPTIEQPAVVLGGDCTQLLSRTEASDLIGADAVLDERLVAYDPGILGGVSCGWAAVGDAWPAIFVAAYPAAVVPEAVVSQAGVIPECIGGYECAYGEIFGDTWVYASGSSADQVVHAVAVAGPRAAAEPGADAALPPTAWGVPPCEEIRELIAAHLDRIDLGPYAGDNMPSGMQWDVLEQNGVASWCSSLGDGNDRYTEEIEVYLGPGATRVSQAALDQAGGTAIELAHSHAAWVLPGEAPAPTRVVARTEENVIIVTARFLDPQTLAELADVLIEHLDSARG